jgi:hypothetical protein
VLWQRVPSSTLLAAAVTTCYIPTFVAAAVTTIKQNEKATARAIAFRKIFLFIFLLKTLAEKARRSAKMAKNLFSLFSDT